MCRVLGFVVDYDDPLKGLQQDLKGLGPAMSRVLEAVTPSLERRWDPKGILRDLFLGPFGADLATVGTAGSQDGGDRLAGHAQELTERVHYASWIVLGLLCCPSEILGCSHRSLGAVKVRGMNTSHTIPALATQAAEQSTATEHWTAQKQVAPVCWQG